MLDRKSIRIAIPRTKQDVRNYINAVRGVGAEPVIVSVNQESAEPSAQQEILDIKDFRPQDFDGMLLPGGADIDPARYGEENRSCYNVEPELDELQFSVLDQCVKAGVPVFGICRGCQVINVYFGGTMIQHLDTSENHVRENTDTSYRVHDGDAVKGSWIEGLYGEHFPHNSSHHQAVGRLGDGLIIDEISSADQVVEAIHHEKLPVYAVQWHPERMCFEHESTDTVDGSKVLRWFVSKCSD